MASQGGTQYLKLHLTAQKLQNGVSVRKVGGYLKVPVVAAKGED